MPSEQKAGLAGGSAPGHGGDGRPSALTVTKYLSVSDTVTGIQDDPGRKILEICNICPSTVSFKTCTEKIGSGLQLRINPLSWLLKNSKFAACSKMVRCKEAKKTRARSVLH
jgi:hypothetical protein